jgi:hypothetical protein
MQVVVVDTINEKEIVKRGTMALDEGRQFLDLLGGTQTYFYHYAEVRLTGLYDSTDDSWDLVSGEALDAVLSLLELLSSAGDRHPVEVTRVGNLIEMREEVKGTWVTIGQVFVPEHLRDVAPRIENIVRRAVDLDAERYPRS